MKLILCAIILISCGYCSDDLSQWRTSYPAGEGSSSGKSFFSKLRLFGNRPQSATTSEGQGSKYEYSSNSNCSCGLTNSLSTRVVNGTETIPHKYPWVLIIIWLGLPDAMCGGSIITVVHVLTAAHCTNGSRPNEVIILIGRHNRTNPDETGAQSHTVKKIYEHEDFNETSRTNDIAILVTKHKMVFTSYVSPVCLPSHEFNLIRQELKAVGWGDTKGTGNRDVLREVDFTVARFTFCMSYWGIDNDTKTRICAVGHHQDTCQGDSGGGLYYMNPETLLYTQVGVTSYGDENCTAQKPSVNTYVYAYMEWIILKVSKDKRKAKICTGD